MKLGRHLFLTLLGLGLASSTALASTITFVTPTGALDPVGGLPVNASASFTTSANTVSVTLSNLQANPTSVAQVLTDLSFTLDGGTITQTQLQTSLGTLVNINGAGVPTLGTTGLTGWNLDLVGVPGSIHLCAIGNSPCGGALAPTRGIIGPPGPGGLYTNANGSIAGNNAHNPFLDLSATFTLFVPGVTSATNVTGATFSFNTTVGDDVPGVPQQPPPPRVPEPSSVVLLGTGLAYFATRLRRRA
jgi:hypothetical protein